MTGKHCKVQASFIDAAVVGAPMRHSWLYILLFTFLHEAGFLYVYYHLSFSFSTE
jgi:hypothetical protein